MGLTPFWSQPLAASRWIAVLVTSVLVSREGAGGCRLVKRNPKKKKKTESRKIKIEKTEFGKKSSGFHRTLVKVSWGILLSSWTSFACTSTLDGFACSTEHLDRKSISHWILRGKWKWFAAVQKSIWRPKTLTEKLARKNLKQSRCSLCFAYVFSFSSMLHWCSGYLGCWLHYGRDGAAQILFPGRDCILVRPLVVCLDCALFCASRAVSCLVSDYRPVILPHAHWDVCMYLSPLCIHINAPCSLCVCVCVWFSVFICKIFGI